MSSTRDTEYRVRLITSISSSSLKPYTLNPNRYASILQETLKLPKLLYPNGSGPHIHPKPPALAKIGLSLPFAEEPCSGLNNIYILNPELSTPKPSSIPLNPKPRTLVVSLLLPLKVSCSSHRDPGFLHQKQPKAPPALQTLNPKLQGFRGSGRAIGL